MKKIVSSVSAIALMALSPAALANPVHHHGDKECSHKMDAHCRSHHDKKCKEHRKDHCKGHKDGADILNTVSAIENTPRVHYEIRSIFLKGGPDRIARYDRDISSEVASAGGNIDQALAKIAPRNKNRYSAEPLSLDFQASFAHHMGMPPMPPHGGPDLPPPPAPNVFGHHQAFVSETTGEYDLGTPRVDIHQGAIYITPSVKGGDAISSAITPQEVTEVHQTLRNDPKAYKIGDVSAQIPSGKSIVLDIPHYESVTSNSIDVFYEYVQASVEKTGRSHHHDVIDNERVQVKGAGTLRLGTVNALVMPYSKAFKGQEVVLVKPIVEFGPAHGADNLLRHPGDVPPPPPIH